MYLTPAHRTLLVVKSVLVVRSASWCHLIVLSSPSRSLHHNPICVGFDPDAWYQFELILEMGSGVSVMSEIGILKDATMSPLGWWPVRSGSIPFSPGLSFEM